MTITRRGFIAASAAATGMMLTGCAGSTAEKGGRAYSLRIIDAHAHWYPREFVTLMEKEGPENGARMGRDAAGNAGLFVRNGIPFDCSVRAERARRTVEA
ncbi:MAG: twin-arginine translocation signal domain-containing protein [Burkholderiales bacterium]